MTSQYCARPASPTCGSRSTGRDSNHARRASTTTGPSATSRCWPAAEAIDLRIWATLHDGSIPRWFDNDGGFDDDETFITWWPRWVERVADRFGDQRRRVGALRRDPSRRSDTAVARHLEHSRGNQSRGCVGAAGARPRSTSTSDARRTSGSLLETPWEHDEAIGDRQLESGLDAVGTGDSRWCRRLRRTGRDHRVPSGPRRRSTPPALDRRAADRRRSTTRSPTACTSRCASSNPPSPHPTHRPVSSTPTATSPPPPSTSSLNEGRVGPTCQIPRVIQVRPR